MKFKYLLSLVFVSLACGMAEIPATIQPVRVVPTIPPVATYIPTSTPHVIEPRRAFVVGAWNCRDGAGTSNDVKHVIADVPVQIWMEAQAADGSTWYLVEPYRCWIHSAAVE